MVAVATPWLPGATVVADVVAEQQRLLTTLWLHCIRTGMSVAPFYLHNLFV